jgi:hypothetical protein
VSARALFLSDIDASAAIATRAFLRPDEVDAAVGRLARKCPSAFAIESSDDYATASAVPNAPVFRAICGADWFHVDGSNGAVIERLDQSGRLYRWLFAGLHRFDFPVLTVRPALRTGLIVVLCGCGFIFSVTGIVIAGRRLLSCLR